MSGRFIVPHRRRRLQRLRLILDLLEDRAVPSVLYDESISGDLSNNQNAPTQRTAALGTNSVLGTVGGVTGSQDWLTITVPSGMVLDSIVLFSYVSSDVQGFTGVQAGTSFVGDTNTPGSYLGYAHFGTAADNGGPPQNLIGQDILPIMSNAFGAQGFDPPLAAGSYTFLIQQLGSNTSYQFDYVTESLPPADLTLTKSHVGDFRQGDAAKTYSIVVSNAGTGPTSGTVTVSDTLPTGLTPTAANNGVFNGWNVGFVGQTITATRSNVLAAGNNYPALTITVDVAADAQASVTNTATVSGGGQVNTANDSDDDPTTIIQVADLTINKLHTGDFTQGDTGRTYTIEVDNIGPGPTTGTVTITDIFPTGLIPTAANNGVIAGWNVSTVGQTVTATRSDVLANGASYPDLTLTVDVDFDAVVGILNNTATVSGGGEINTANNSDIDPTPILLYTQPNQAPVNTLPANFSTDEDVPLVLAGLSIADPDAGNANIRVTLTVGNGTLTIDTGVNGGITAGQVTDNGTDEVVIIASRTAINTTFASANGLRFTPLDDTSGVETLTMTTNDLGNHGNDGPKSDTDLASIAVASINDAPEITLPATNSTPADTPLIITGVSIADVDADNEPLFVVLSVDHGTLTLNTSVPGGVANGDVSGNGTQLVTVFAPSLKINTTLANALGLAFAPTAAFSGDATLTLNANDLGSTGGGGAKSDFASQLITVASVLFRFTLDMPANVVAGESFQLTVTARDQFDNPIVNYGGSISLLTNDLQGTLPSSATFTNGEATFTATLKTAGNQVITATDSASPSINVQASVTVAHAALAALAFESLPSGAIVGAPLTIRVVGRDAFNNLATNATDVVLVRLSSNPSAALLLGTTKVALSNGVATFTGLKITKAGEGYKLSASTSSSPAVVSSQFDIAAVARFAVTTTQFTGVAGDVFSVTVRALNGLGQIVPNYAGKVRLTSSDPQAVLPVDTTLTNGEGTFLITLKTAGKRTITAFDTAKPTVRGALPKLITIAPGAVTALRATGLDAPTSIGRRQLLTIHAIDAYGNINPGYRELVALTSSDTSAAVGFHIFTARDAGKFTFPVTLNSVGLHSVTADDGTLETTKSNIVVASSSMSVFTQADPGNATKTALVVFGTPGADLIEVFPTNATGTQLDVRVNGFSFGTTFAPTGNVLLYGLGGNDSIQVRQGVGAFAGVHVAVPMVIDGGLGNDIIAASSTAGAILLGGDGNDQISGSSGRDLIIGGRGKDVTNGTDGEDILIGGATKHDLTGLLSIMDEWGDTGTPLLTRILHLQGLLPGGANGPHVLNASTIPNDNAIDNLIGEGDTDWFVFASSGLFADLVLDAFTGEVLTGL
jgi:hypothetical protein